MGNTMPLSEGEVSLAHHFTLIKFTVSCKMTNKKQCTHQTDDGAKNKGAPRDSGQQGLTGCGNYVTKSQQLWDYPAPQLQLESSLPSPRDSLGKAMQTI